MIVVLPEVEPAIRICPAVEPATPDVIDASTRMGAEKVADAVKLEIAETDMEEPEIATLPEKVTDPVKLIAVPAQIFESSKVPVESIMSCTVERRIAGVIAPVVLSGKFVVCSVPNAERVFEVISLSRYRRVAGPEAVRRRRRRDVIRRRFRCERLDTVAAIAGLQSIDIIQIFLLEVGILITLDLCPSPFNAKHDRLCIKDWNISIICE